MRRRRFVLASLATLTGCTSAGYRATGPRSPPPAPPTRSDPASTPSPVEERAQAVIRPLNDVYRELRGPLSDLDLGYLTTDALAPAEASLDEARTAFETFSAAVENPPPEYQSLAAIVDAHGHLLDAFAAMVDLQQELTALLDERVDGATARLSTARRRQEAVADATAAIADVTASQPTIPSSVLLGSDRLSRLSSDLSAATTALERLLDGVEQVRSAEVNWREGSTAFGLESYEVARQRFQSALDAYGRGNRALDGVSLRGSFEETAEHVRCLADAGVDASQTALDAVDAATTGDTERAAALFGSARERKSDCS